LTTTWQHIRLFIKLEGPPTPHRLTPNVPQHNPFFNGLLKPITKGTSTQSNSAPGTDVLLKLIV
ncbi:MAG: hypothetical protein KDA52_14060, partial [Planctomycetaceae bacterium]|nr:hypothetical protein [Planctomycetaceae bacterium]